MEKEAIDNLIRLSRDAMSRAYCPYSKFPVGAALLSDDGSIFTGMCYEAAHSGLKTLVLLLEQEETSKTQHIL